MNNGNDRTAIITGVHDVAGSDDLIRLRTWPVTRLRCCERARRGLGGYGLACCCGKRDGALSASGVKSRGLEPSLRIGCGRYCSGQGHSKQFVQLRSAFLLAQ
jgi:hypothetical protein